MNRNLITFKYIKLISAYQLITLENLMSNMEHYIQGNYVIALLFLLYFDHIK